MSEGRVKASKARVHPLPDGAAGADGRYHVYVFDVFQRGFLPGKSFDNVERASQFQRHEQERIYAEQEADPELFDLPFISADPQLLEHIESNPEYKARLMRELDAEARARGRKRS